MNNKQHFVGVLAAAVFALALFFPPWLYTYDRNGEYGGHTSKPAGFSCILSPPSPQELDEHCGVRMDASRLFVECLFILAVGGASWFWMGRDVASKPSQPAPFWPTSMKQWLFIAGLGVLAAGSVAITVVTLNESSRKVLPEHKGYVILEPEETVDQLRTNADKGQPDSQHSLGWRYLNGDGVIKDYVEAAKWFRKAADQGNALAQCNLGYCYQNGFGIQKDYVRAYMWYNLAAAQGQPDSVTNLALLEKEMTPEQIAEAQRLSREFKAFKAGSGSITTNGLYRYQVQTKDGRTFLIEADSKPTEEEVAAEIQRLDASKHPPNVSAGKAEPQ